MFYIAKNIFGKTDNRATQQFMWKRLIHVIPLWWYYVTLTLIYKVYYLLKTNSLIETFDLLDWAFIF
jgi:hypothetical protein